tara:strand:+ start:3446 stop:4048 length:603 start_codon:yes stop_codon:yes gene_type:complete
MIKTSQSYANEESFHWYVKYLAMKRHFTSDGYDYIKYRGKIRASFEKYRTRNDAYFFEKLSRKDDPEKLMLSNMIVKPNAWIREIIEQEGDDRYMEWQRKIDTLSRIFKSEINLLDDNFQANFTSVNGQHPLIMMMYLQKKVSLETLTIMSHIANIFPYWDKEIVDKIVARDIIRLTRKYKPFLEIDEKKFKDLIRDRFF